MARTPKPMLQELKSMHDVERRHYSRAQADWMEQMQLNATNNHNHHSHHHSQQQQQQQHRHRQQRAVQSAPITGKPPTPPPTQHRERSATPPGATSPRRPLSPRERRQRNATQEVHAPPSYDSATRPQQQAHSFEHLENLVYEHNNVRPGYSRQQQQQQQYGGGYGSNTQPASQHSGRDQPDSVVVVNQGQRSHVSYAQQSPKSILKKPRFAQQPNNSQHDYPMTNGPQNGRGSAPEAQRFQQPLSETARSETPQFPVQARGNRDVDSASPRLPYHPLLYQPNNNNNNNFMEEPYGCRSQYQGPAQVRSPSPGSMYYGQHSRRSSVTSLEPMEVIHHHPVFVKDTSKFWYKPNITREEAINILKDKQPGTFIIRDSNSFPGAFGLAMKVAQPPPGVQAKSGDGTELVRHFLIEPSVKGVKLKGCNNEPVFGSLSALVYQHSITPLALPSKLLLPDYDIVHGPEHSNAAQALLEQGAACNVTYLFTCDTESLTGPEAVRRTIDKAFGLLAHKQVLPVSVHFKVSAQGITVTDNTRKLFFRRHYPTNAITFCGLDPEDRRWSHTLPSLDQPVVREARLFGFVARKVASRTDNSCHVFAELEPEQPATAIVNFVTKVMMGPIGAGQGQQPLRPN